MPVYQVITTEETLNDAQRERIVADITKIHCDATGAPALFVNVVFQELKPGRTFSAGKASDLSIVAGTIRAGRTLETKQQMMRAIGESWTDITSAPLNDILVTIQETDARTSMELGLIFPNPGEEDAWFEENRGRLAELGITSLA